MLLAESGRADFRAREIHGDRWQNPSRAAESGCVAEPGPEKSQMANLREKARGRGTEGFEWQE